jgi:hypothetical protein
MRPRARDSLLRHCVPTLRCAPVGNDTQRYLRVIPGERQAREGDRLQNRARSSLPLAGRDKGWGWCGWVRGLRVGRSSPLPEGEIGPEVRVRGYAAGRWSFMALRAPPHPRCARPLPTAIRVFPTGARGSRSRQHPRSGERRRAVAALCFTDEVRNFDPATPTPTPPRKGEGRARSILHPISFPCLRLAGPEDRQDGTLPFLLVMAGPVPAIPMGKPQRWPCRDARHKAGHDGRQPRPAVTTAQRRKEFPPGPAMPSGARDP